MSGCRTEHLNPSASNTIDWRLYIFTNDADAAFLYDILCLYLINI